MTHVYGGKTILTIKLVNMPITPKSSFDPTGSPSFQPSLSPITKQSLICLYSLSIYFHFLEFYVNNTIQEILFWFTFLFSINILKSSMLLCITIVYSLLVLNSVLYIPWFVYLLSDEHLVFFPLRVSVLFFLLTKYLFFCWLNI